MKDKWERTDTELYVVVVIISQRLFIELKLVFELLTALISEGDLAIFCEDLVPAKYPLPTMGMVEGFLSGEKSVRVVEKEEEKGRRVGDDVAVIADEGCPPFPLLTSSL